MSAVIAVANGDYGAKLHNTSESSSPVPQCPKLESNQRHEDFQSSALPTELSGRINLEAQRKSKNLEKKFRWEPAHIRNFLSKFLR